MGTEKLEATATLGPGGQINWKLCHTNAPPPNCGTTKADYPVVTLQPSTGAQNFQVKINDNTGLNIKFADTNPLWIQANSQPTGPVVDPQITGIAVQTGGKVLNFVDTNSLPSQTQPAPLTLKYQLNFKGDGGAQIPPIDPDIRNGGTSIVTPPPGGEAGYVDPSSIYFGAAAISALTAAVVAYVVARYMMRGRGPMR